MLDQALTFPDSKPSEKTLLETAVFECFERPSRLRWNSRYPKPPQILQLHRDSRSVRVDDEWDLLSVALSRG